MKIFKNKKFLISSAVILTSFLFLATASSAWAADCSHNSVKSYISSFLNPLASLAEKVVKDFGYNVALATAPDPDFCGSDSAACSGSSPYATISWEAAPDPIYYEGTGHSLSYNVLTISGVGSWNTGLSASYSVLSNLANNTTYNWSVEAYYCYWYCDNIVASHSFGYTNQPYGSFTTPNCAPPPPTDDAKFISQSVPTTLTINQTVSVSITMKNCRPNNDCSNLNPWLKTTPTGDSYRLITLNPYTPSIRNGVDWWNAQDIALSNDVVAVGSSNTFTFNITAPSTPGTYNFQWIMLHGGVSPFGEFTPNVQINVVSPPPPVCTLTISKSGSGSGTVSASGISCGSDCSETYDCGTSVTLTANPASGSTFSGWSGDADCSDGVVTVNVPKSCTAIFNVIPADFSLNSSNSIYATLVQGQDGDSSATTLTISSFYGFSSNISLSVQSVSPSLPSGSTFNFNPSTLTSAQYSSGSQFKVHIGAGLSASQTYTITIRGQDGGLVRTTNVLLNAQVKNPDWREI